MCEFYWHLLYFLLQCKREGFVQKIKEEEGEGCNIHGMVEVNKVAGNIHFAPGKSFLQSNILVHDLLGVRTESFNVSMSPLGHDFGCSKSRKIL